MDATPTQGDPGREDVSTTALIEAIKLTAPKGEGFHWKVKESLDGNIHVILHTSFYCQFEINNVAIDSLSQASLIELIEHNIKHAAIGMVEMLREHADRLEGKLDG